ncbi:GfV-D2-ORF1 [Ichnoviriform fumiferanae]|uniref:GfV-D2-ORF1 n=1 Tax=Ichnoviriform fumiferanae TaxID=419435 RepID=A2PZZ4_9VIRU|nr:GfV-D2-ORF1 [Ichnoviriform fumiferanae]BAF45566.1 GfV-D2-ORF1 [Ichnoviriform fumiferanae]
MSSRYNSEFYEREASIQMPNKTTSAQFAETIKNSIHRHRKLRNTTLALTKKIESLKYDKKSRQCKLLNTTVRKIYTRNTINNLYNQKALMEKKDSEHRSEIVQWQKKIKELRQSKNKILSDYNKKIKLVDICLKKVKRLKKCVRKFRGKFTSLRKNIQKSKGQNDTFLPFLDSKRNRSVDMPKTFDDSEERYEKMTEYLSTKLPSRLLPLTVQQVNIMGDSQFRLTVRSANETNIFFIIPHLCVLINEDNTEFYFLEKKISSNNPSLGSVCAEMEKGFVVSFHKDTFVFEAKSNMSDIMILRNPFEVTDSFIIFPDDTMSTEELHLFTIQKVLRAEFIKLLWMKYGMKFEDKDDDNIVTKNVKNVDSTRSEVELVRALFDVFPNLSIYYRYSHNTFYYCDAKTNIWDSLTNDEFYHHIQQTLKSRIQLTEAELINVTTKDTIVKIIDIIMRKIEDVDFTKQLDSLSHIFVTDNKAIDMSIFPPVMRSIRCEDLIKRTNGWTYDPDLSHKYKKSVQSYFNKLLPKPCEQIWFLSFIARMLNGKRSQEPCVILTDKRRGKSGKSTLTYLLHAVFGNYYLNDSIIESLGKSNLENKRLFVADGSKKDKTLTGDFIKSIINSDYVTAEDTNCNTHSIFPIQAGLIIVSPKHDVLICDTNDKDLLNRIVTCPMRSRFVSKKKNGLYEKTWRRYYRHLYC